MHCVPYFPPTRSRSHKIMLRPVNSACVVEDTGCLKRRGSPQHGEPSELVVDASTCHPSLLSPHKMSSDEAQKFIDEVWGLQGVAYLVLLLRYYSRIVTLGWGKLALDDFLIALATVCCAFKRMTGLGDR